MKKSTALIALWLGATSYPSIANAADLLSAVHSAAAHDASLASARSAYLAAEQATPKALAELLPRIDAGWGRIWNQIKYDDVPAGYKDKYSYWQNGWSVGLSQPIFDWSRWTGYRQSELVVARAGIEYATAQQNLLLRASDAYFQALAAEEEVARTERYIATLQIHLKLVEKKQAAGESTRIDIADAQTSLEQAHLQKEQAIENLRLKRLALEQLTGEPATPLAKLRDGAILPKMEPESETAWAEQAQISSYPVQLGEMSRRIAEMETDKARAGHYPVVSFNASHTPAGAAGGYAEPTTTTTAMMQVTVPLFAGGAIQAKVDESRALEQKAQEDLTDAARQSEKAARESFLRIEAGRSRIQRLISLQRSARQSFEATSIGYNVGSRIGTDVLRSLEILYNSESDLIRARYDLIMAVLNLKATAASLTIEDIEKIDALLDKRTGS